MRWLAVLVALTGVSRAEKISTDIDFLAKPELDGRVAGSDGDRAARAYITKRMTDAGLTVSEQAFEFEGTKTANVVGFIKGESDDIIIVGAHYDHLGDGHLGANDNASGVAGMLAIADRFAGTTPKRTLAFIAFGGEEAGLMGSTFYVAHPPDALPMANVVEYINLDMIGSYQSKGWVAAMGTFAKLPARKALDKLVKKYRKLHVGLGGRAARSDHAPFCEAGIPYVFFWTPDTRCYHETCDKADKIDAAHMADIVSLAGDLAGTLSDSKTDLAAARKKLGCAAK
jgi:Zn-dependent M28 family amino/carboxypeptidase